MRLQKKKTKVNQEPSLKASRIRAYVEPILRLFIESKIIENLKLLDTRDARIDISIINNIRIARKIVLTDLSNKNDRKLLVK